MPDFGIFRGFNSKLFSDKLYAGQLPTQLGTIGSISLLLLLDLFPSAAAAYSLRKLRYNYTGSAIRVRRSSDNNEQDIGFNATGNLDTTALTSFCGSGNGFVTTWYDQSGNGRNATQSTAANQSQIVSSGTVILENGKPSVQFDGSNDTFTIANISLVNSLSSAFVVALTPSAPTTAAVGYTIFSGGAGSYQYRYGSTNFNGFTNIVRSQQLEIITGNTNIINQFTIDSVFTSNSGTSIYVNSNLDNSNSLNPSFTQPISRIGGTAIPSEYFKGNLSEIIIYLSDQSTNRTAIESNINSYYQIY